MNRQEKEQWLQTKSSAKYRIRLHDEFQGSSTRWVVEDFNASSNVVEWTYGHFASYQEALHFYQNQVS